MKIDPELVSFIISVFWCLCVCLFEAQVFWKQEDCLSNFYLSNCELLIFSALLLMPLIFYFKQLFSARIISLASLFSELSIQKARPFECVISDLIPLSRFIKLFLNISISDVCIIF